MTAQNSCARCGASLAPGVHFCSKCGLDVSGEQSGAATARISAVTAEDPQAGLIEDLRKATLGEFEIAGELGRGGMATVYMAHEIALDRKVAIKVMAPALLQSGPGMADRFKREARTAAALSHPHIIPIYGVRESGRLLFFIMKYVQGRGLDAIIKEHGPLPIKMVQAILSQAGSALDYAHRHGVVHRDIKPANIMLDVEGWAVVTDFGIAKVSDSQGLTMTGATIGTPTYMSPEQCAAKTITGATDQYSLGVAAFEMLTGHVPFDADSVMSLMWQHFHEPPPPILERRPDCPPAVAMAVERMLAKAPADRWPSLEDAVEAIGTPPINDPVRQHMKALARGGPLSDAAMRATPISPVPRGVAPPTPPARPELPSTPVMPIPPAPSASVTGAPTTPIPAVPISGQPTLPEELVDSPTALVATPPPPSTPTLKAKTTPPPAVRVPPPAPPAPRRRPSGISPSVTRPGPTTPVPPPFKSGQRGGPPLLRWLVVAAVLGGAAYGAWTFLNRPPAPALAPTPRAPTGPAPVTSVAVTPSPAGIVVGKTAQLRAVLKDDHGNALTGRTVSWTSADSTMVRVSSSGVVTGLAPGLVTVTASSEGITGTGTVNVTATAAPVVSLDVLPGVASVAQGDTLPLTAAPKDAQGNTLSGHDVTWRSSDPRVASVSAAGTVTALRLGSAEISAVVEGKRAAARLTVIPPPVAFVSIAPPTVSLQVGGRAELGIQATDAHNRALTGRTATWTTSAPDVATVSPLGVVVAVGPGRATVTVRVEAQSASASVTVAAIPVAKVAISPASLTLAVGKTAPLGVTLQDARGRTLRDRDVQWASNDAGVATVSASGTVSAVTAGKATITATSEGITASAVVTVPAPPAPPVAVTPPVAQPPAQQPAESQPVAVPPPTNPEPAAARTMPRRDVSAGGSHSCGITQSGAAVCWGSNASGQMGDGSVGAGSNNPALVSSSASFTALVTGGDHSCGLTQSGGVICWGANTKGQLGNGRTAGPPAPAAVVGNHTFQSLTAGTRHTCGIATDGTAWCWGDNNSGQLGDGSTRGSNRPVQVRGSAKFTLLAAGSDHTCGLATDGRVWCWGDGFSGQLGRGSRESQSEPVAVEADVKFTAVTAGGKHACALAQNGKAYCWGANASGEVGDGSTSERDRPTLVSGARTYTQISAGPDHTCALTDGGAAYCWGRNREGELGDGSRIGHNDPVRVSADQAFNRISAGATHTCAVQRDGGVVCWGGNGKGQLGDGTVTLRATPTPVEAR
jgi:serine/threonine protein kinase/alpha-tubulin suppressor-like RCC1 family protein/uncharacterized protein YjdB